jgi:hypothetical protein
MQRPRLLYASGMPPTRGRSRLFLAGLSLVLHISCTERHSQGSGGLAPAGKNSAGPTSISPPAKVPLKTTPLPGSDPPEAQAPVPPLAITPQAPEAGSSGQFTLGSIQDAGPAAPIAAHKSGIYFITKTGGMYIARREGDTLVGINAPREDFFRYGRGPAISPTHAYWVSSQGELTRAPLKGGPPEPLTQARSGARVSVITHDRDVVFYLADEGNHLRAMLYTERDKAMRISPDGADVTSLAVVENGAFPRALMLEGRSGMSPLVVRTVRLRAQNIELGPDEVVWVGPGSQPLTEVRATALPGTGGMAFVATSRTVLEFGLASLHLSPTGQLAAEPMWRMYENGIDPAPAETVTTCGKTYVLFALPTTRKPRAPQELRIAKLTPNGFQEEETLVRARAFNDVSAAPLADAQGKAGFLVAWTADHRTWGMVVHCRTA